MTTPVDSDDDREWRTPTQTMVLPAAPSYPTGTEARQRNRFAVAGLVLGILPLPPLGAVFSILGIMRARVVRVGATISIVGLVLSVLWAGTGVAAALVTPHVVKAANPGCRVLERYDRDYPASKLAADKAAGAAYIADLQAFSASLNRAAELDAHPDVRAAALTEAADVDIILQYLNQGAEPDAATVMKQQTDNDVLHKACGSY